jgi:hypothetical protein
MSGPKERREQQIVLEYPNSALERVTIRGQPPRDAVFWIWDKDQDQKRIVALSFADIATLQAACDRVLERVAQERGAP